MHGKVRPPGQQTAVVHMRLSFLYEQVQFGKAVTTRLAWGIAAVARGMSGPGARSWRYGSCGLISKDAWRGMWESFN